MSEHITLPNSWAKASIDVLLERLEDGRSLHHGWSPQCETEPSESDKDWGVLKTTAIQDGVYLSEHNKKLPNALTPRSHLEVKTGDILITCAGPRNRCGVPCLVRHTRPRLILSGKMYRFRVRQQFILPSFMEGFLRSKDAQAEIDRMKTGISDSGLNLTHGRFFGLQVPVAPLNEQCRIVAKIDELFSDLDAGVAALERAKANLKRYRAAVLKAAVEGKLTEQWRAEHPNTEPASKLLARILTERRQTWEAAQLAKFAAAGKQPSKNWLEKYVEPKLPARTGLSDLPRGWCWASIGQLYEVKYGLSEPLKNTAPNSPDDLPVLSIKNVNSDGCLIVDELKYFPVPRSKRTGLLLKRGDLLFNWRNAPNLIGKTAIFDLEGAYVNASFLLRMRPANQDFDGKFAWLYVNHLRLRGYFQMESNAAVNQSNFNASKTSSVLIPLPPLDEQREIIRQTALHFSELDRAQEIIRRSELRAIRLRLAVLKQAFEGKLVPQDPMDERPSLLLERTRAALPLPAPSRNGDNAKGPKRRNAQRKAGAKGQKGGAA